MSNAVPKFDLRLYVKLWGIPEKTGSAPQRRRRVSIKIMYITADLI